MSAEVAAFCNLLIGSMCATVATLLMVDRAQWYALPLAVVLLALAVANLFLFVSWIRGAK